MTEENFAFVSRQSYPSWGQKITHSSSSRWNISLLVLTQLLDLLRQRKMEWVIMKPNEILYKYDNDPQERENKDFG